MSTVALHGEDWSLVIELAASGAPLWRHLGPKVTAVPDWPLAAERGPATFSLDVPGSMTVAPAAGAGWFGPSLVALEGEDGMALPLAFTEGTADSDGTRLTVDLRDALSGIALRVTFRRLPGDGIEVTTMLLNQGDRPVRVARLASALLPLPATMREIVSFRGRHNAELAECREAMPAHRWVRETRRGIPGHGGPPGCLLLGRDATDDHGLAISAQLAWSGDSLLAVEYDDEGFWTLGLEAVAVPGERVLQPGGSLAGPPVLLAISAGGRNGAMAAQHSAVRSRLSWPGGAMRPRPVHLNSWEACYFDHDEARIEALARSAAALGIERFVLDDGWFKGRDHDRAALGDWTEDPRKYPHGLAPLAHKVTGLGMEFGLWVEPEMVNPDSDLYRAHPDWALALPGRERPTARHQLVLDMRRAEVRDYLFDRLDALLRSAPIGYLKWDHNRDHAPSGGAAQVLGTYALLERLRAAHPEVEIESCAGGGGRIDAGIAAYTHRFWTSDNIDAVSRTSIQRGFLAFMPPETMGAHVGASPSHATGRRQSLSFRAAIACMGHLGVELNPAALEDRDRARLAEWIAFYKRWRPVIHGGALLQGSGSDGLLWQAHGDGTRWLLFAIRTAPPTTRRAQPVLLPFAQGRDWKVRALRMAGAGRWPGTAPWSVGDDAAQLAFGGDWLAGHGLPLPFLPGEAVAIFALEPAA